MTAGDRDRADSSRCSEIIQRLCAEAGKEADSPFCREVTRHLAGCPSCREQAKTLRGTVELYRCLERTDVPREVAQRLRAALGL